MIVQWITKSWCGQILGGDSAVNGLVWIRGAQEEYDAIEALGSPTWNWNSLYENMKKVHHSRLVFSSEINVLVLQSETLHVPSPALVASNGYVIEPASHGTTGPVDVSFPAFLPLYVPHTPYSTSICF